VLEQAVISDLRAGGVSVPIRFWADRRARAVRNVEVVEGIEDEAPVGFQGLLDYAVIDVSWEAVNDDYGTYLATDLAEAYRAIGRVERDANGNPVPKALYWRDPRRRGFPVMVTDYREDDPHSVRQASGDMALVQVSTSSHLEVG
jgi:hypothetical protein